MTSTQFYSDCLGQLDLALDQLAVNDRDFDRFAMMLVDNVVELVMHRIAQNTTFQREIWRVIGDPKAPEAVVDGALGRQFDRKVKLVRELGLLEAPICESINYLHEFRNTAYHQGRKHEGLLHSLTGFYLSTACQLLSAYSPGSWSSSSTDRVSHRATKYLGRAPLKHLGIGHADNAFSDAWARVQEVVATLELDVVGDLATDMRRVIDDIDQALQFLSDEGPGALSRDGVLLESQAWALARTDEGKKLLEGCGLPERDIPSRIEWLKSSYCWQIVSDPVPAWRSRADVLSRLDDPHAALRDHRGFMRQTSTFRNRIHEDATQLDGYIQDQVDVARGK